MIRAMVRSSRRAVCLWPSSATDYGQSVILDGAGNAYVNGMYIGSASFGDDELTVSGATGGVLEDGFVAKLDPEGKFIWATGGGDALKITAAAIGLVSVGNVYAAGWRPPGQRPGHDRP
jgi:hypothetical protein